jgi:uncharacterized protein (DUF4415 family)
MTQKTLILDEDDVPELTRERASKLQRAVDVLPAEVFAQLKRSPGRPRAEAPKKQVTLRLDADVLDHWRAQGPGWQSGINAALRRASGL